MSMDPNANETPYKDLSNRMRENRKQLKQLAVASAVLIVLAIICCVVVMCKILTPMNYYNHGADLMLQKNYSEAIEYFEQANGYKDSEEQIRICEKLLNGTVYAE